MDKDKTIEKLQNTINTMKDTMAKDRQFYIIALNISGDREYCEKRAAELIGLYGHIKALDVSKHSEI